MTRFPDEEPEMRVPWDHCIECQDPIWHKPASVLAPRCEPCTGLKLAEVVDAQGW